MSTKKHERFATRSKTTANYWATGNRLFKFARKSANGATTIDAEYSMQISFRGRRSQFQLHTPIKAEAASKAARIYCDIVGKGWDEALEIHKPNAKPKKLAADTSLPPATVGSLISANARFSSARPESLEAYSKALRRIVAGIFNIAKGKKYDAFRGGRAAWIDRIDSKALSELTPAAVLAWRNQRIRAAKTPEERGRATVTTNSLIRNAKALLSNKVRPFIEQEMKLPSPLFFEGISAEPEPNLRYRSKIDAGEILEAARQDLAEQPETLKLLVLTLVCGLRRSEADTLLWDQFDFKRRILVIEDTEHKRLKSTDSAGEIDLEPEVCEMFEGFAKFRQSPFVLEASKRVRTSSMQDRKTRGYRCDLTQRSLIAWLRKQGVESRRPIHTLRKEIGAIIASREGIWKASRYLRHSDIRITSKLYSDKKVPVTSGLASFLVPPANRD